MTLFNVEDLSDPRLPWKGSDHYNKRFSELDDSFILWMLEKAESERLFPSWLNDAVKKEWGKRNGRS